MKGWHFTRKKKTFFYFFYCLFYLECLISNTSVGIVNIVLNIIPVNYVVIKYNEHEVY